MSLLAKLQAKGVKIYSSSPLYIHTEDIQTVNISDDCVITHNEEFGTYSICIEENNQRVYVPIKDQVSIDKDSYTLAVFTASRDWTEKAIVKGQTKVFAI